MQPTRHTLHPTGKMHRMFLVGMCIKGVDGLLQCIGGILLLSVSTVRLGNIMEFLLQHELSQDPDDAFSNFLLSWVHDLPNGAKAFGGVYLLLNGGIKVFLAIQLLRDKLWAFPVALWLMGILAAYQVYRIALHHSVGLLVLTVIDVIVMAFIWREYRSMEKLVDRAKTACP